MLENCSFCSYRSRWQHGNGLHHCHFCGITGVLNPVTTAVYDERYVADRYDRYPTTEKMSLLRLRLLEQVLYTHEALPNGKARIETGRLLDVGYGNGSFIRACLKNGWDAYGNDVNPTEYPGVRQVDLPTMEHFHPHYRVITFFDALEHFETLDEVRKVVWNTDWIVVSVPVPPRGFLAQPQSWKHWRPGEHHWYFGSPWSLERVFTLEGRSSRVVYADYPEDTIRGKLQDGSPNILTVFLKCEDQER